MLQNTKTRTVTDDIQPDIPQEEGWADFAYLAIGILRRQYLFILFVMTLGLAAGTIYLGVATPIYTAQASLYIDLHRNQIDQQPGIFGNDPIEIESQIQIIKSKAIAESVIKKLQLINAGVENSKLSDFLFGVSANLASDSSMEQVIDAFERNLTVELAGGRVVSIRYNSKSPEVAAQVANAVANAYVTDQLEAKYQANRVATNWLQERQQQLREQADAAQRAVELFKKQNNIITTDGKPLDNAQVVDLNARLVATRAQVSDALARLNRLQAMVRSGPSDEYMEGAISDINNPLVTTLRQQYLELARRESEWSTRYGKDHLAVVNLRNRMQEIRTSLFEELRHTTATAKNEYEIAKLREEDIEKQLAITVAQTRSTSQAQVTLAGLESAAIASRKLYDTFLQQYMGSGQQATFPITEARIISSAAPPLQKSRPKTVLVVVLGLIGGLAAGIGLGVLRDLMDRVFRTSKQVETELQVPCVALVPLIKNEKAGLPWHQAIADRYTKDPKVTADDARIFRTAIDSPLSKFAEEIRSIKLTIDLHMDARPCKIVGFTSTLPNEGKSTIAAALAHVIAQVGGQVLLVDCDLRNPTLSRMLGGSATSGLYDVVSKRVPVADAILKEPKSNLAFLPAGKRIPLFLTAEVLGGESITKLFELLRQNYNYILVDLPPLCPIVDVRASTHFVDAYLLTLEWGRTKIDAVEQSLRSVPSIYEGLIGAILNKTDMEAMGRYDITGRYDRKNYYGRYGYTD